MTWAIEPGEERGRPDPSGGHDRHRAGLQVEAEFTGGIVYIVSGLKTFLETGEPLAVA